MQINQEKTRIPILSKQKVKIRKGCNELNEKFIGLEGEIIKKTIDFAGVGLNGEVLSGFSVKLKKFKKTMLFYEDELVLI